MRDKFLIIIFFVSLISILCYTYSLIYINTNSFIFHISYIISIISLSLLLIRINSVTVLKTRILFVLAWVWTIMMTIPLRLSDGIISNYPGMIYELQIINDILASSRINFNASTNIASIYYFNPALELLITEINIILGINHEYILKYAGPFLGIFTITFLYFFYKSILSKKDAIVSAFLAGSCFHFLMFCSSTVHLSLALMYFTLLLYSLIKFNNKQFNIISIISFFMIVTSHRFTAIVICLYMIIISFSPFIYNFFFKKRLIFKENISYKLTLLLLVVSISWILYVSFPLFINQVKLTKIIIDALLSLKTGIKFPLFGTTINPPIIIRILGDLSIIIFGLTIFIGFLYTIINGNMSSKHKLIIPFASASAIIFIISILIYSKYTGMTDLLPRSYIYIFFSAAPLSLLAIKRASRFLSSSIYQKLFCVFMISLVSVSAVYYSYGYYRYESTMPLNIEDVRFPLQEWKFAGLYVKYYIQSAKIWGDKITFNYIGGYGEVDIQMLQKGLNITLTNWISIYPSDNNIIILRKSMISVPYLNYYVNVKEFNNILKNINLLYNSGEILMPMID